MHDCFKDYGNFLIGHILPGGGAGRTNTQKYAEKSPRPNTFLLHSIVLYLYGQCCSDMCLACCQVVPLDTLFSNSFSFLVWTIFSGEGTF